MKHPPYHLRPNKAVDRLMLIEAIRCLGRPNELALYTYHGFGGPYLEEFRLLHEFFPEMKMVSIEENADTYKRQRFHLPCGKIKLLDRDFKSFLAQYDSRDKKHIFWLDYTGLEYGIFEDFMDLLGKLTIGSVLKVTFRAEPGDYTKKKSEEEFKAKFGAVLPDPNISPPRDFEEFAKLLQEMLRIAAQRVLSSATGIIFQPVSSFCYADGPGMFTLTGIICQRSERKQVRSLFSGWPFRNLNWGRPRRIDMPFLSTKERLHLQKHLPCKRYAGRTLLKVLGYNIDENRLKTENKMKQYADFYRYYPYFVRAIPL